MSDAAVHRRKLAFVLSADHGEMFNAMYFLAGTDADAVLLLPPHLFALNEDSLPYRAHRYESVDEVVAAIDAERPDLVLLFSGYLLVVNRIFDLDALDELLAALRARGLRVVTSDPSVGVLARIDEQALAPGSAGREWLLYHAPRIFERMRHLVHLYLAPEVETPVEHAAWYNPAIAADRDGRRQCRDRLMEWPPMAHDRERWLFVVSREDYELQARLHGQRRFAEQLAARLADAAAQERQPVLIAPGPCLRLFEGLGVRIPQLVALDHCNYTHFMRLLYEAECVFYWNLFSASIVARALSRLPFFAFGRGHLGAVLEPFHEAARSHFYRGCEVPLLDPASPLAIATLAPLAAKLPAALYDPLHANFARAPSPDELIQRLLA